MLKAISTDLLSSYKSHKISYCCHKLIFLSIALTWFLYVWAQYTIAYTLKNHAVFSNQS